MKHGNEKIWAELEKTVERTEEAAKTALNGKKHDHLFQIANWLKQAENLIQRREAIDSDAAHMIASVSQILNSQESQPVDKRQIVNGNFYLQTNEKKSDAKARGKAWRQEYLKLRAKSGEHLHRKTETLYQTSAGLVRGIAYGSESEKRPDKWFLGLPHGQFQEAVLICESLNGAAVQIHLPKSFVEKYGKNFSSAHGQTLFNVIRNAGKIFLNVPNIGTIDLMNFVERGPSKPL
jgi:hypothetical protein